MRREEIIMAVNANPARFLERDRSDKGYVCPVCGSGSGKHGTGLTQWKNNPNHWHCWKCGEGGDIIFWLMRARNLDFNEALEYGAREIGEKIETSNATFQNATLEIQKEKSFNNPHLKEKTAEENANYTAMYEKAAEHLEETEYWAERGLSIETCQKFGIGYVSKWKHPKSPVGVPYSPRLIIPTSEQGYLARDVRKEIAKVEKEYAKMKVGKMSLFNIEAMKNVTLFVVEGEIDALSIEEIGYGALGLGSVVMKQKFIEEIGTIEKKPEIVILNLDNDKAGQETTEWLERELTKRNIFTFIGKINGKYKDVNEALVADRNSFQKKIELTVREAEKAKELSGQDVNSLSYLELGKMEEDVEYFKKYAERKTGYANIDENNRLYPGLFVLGAVTGLGKTTFMNQMGNQLEAMGEEVIYFSYEQSRFELISKGLSRLTYKQSGGKNGISSVQIRKGAKGESLKKAVEEYKKWGKKEIIYEAEFEDTIEKVCEYVKKRISERGKSPIVIVDYLQVVAPSVDKNGRQLNTKENIDNTVKKLKSLQREYGLVMFLISSLNRQNYMTQIDFESFKESGGIEYTADVVWELQLVETKKLKSMVGIDEKREAMKKAKAENPRRVELVCLKSRYSAPSYSCYFKYYAGYDYFEESTEEEVAEAMEKMSEKQTREEDEQMVFNM